MSVRTSAAVARYLLVGTRPDRCGLVDARVGLAAAKRPMSDVTATPYIQPAWTASLSPDPKPGGKPEERSNWSYSINQTEKSPDDGNGRGR